MKKKETNRKTYTTYELAESINKAKNILDKIKKKKIPMDTYRIDAETLIQIKAGKDPNKIITKVKNRQKIVSINQENEYGQYA